ncbi:UNVERIFIED_CONTAM: hypothetical protein GTU68_044238 [Idotea baltica]|nr:hypothetical protein [Idotea baltica]
MQSPVNFFALGAGSGLAPVAPGTFGTAAAIPIAMLMPSNLVVYALIVIASFVLGVWLCDVCANNLRVHDHPAIVFDEWVGYLITMFAVPKSLWFLALGFVLFRIFDVLKPWPIGLADKQVSGGVGIMVDDVIAGIFAAISMQIIIFILSYFGVPLDTFSVSKYF